MQDIKDTFEITYEKQRIDLTHLTSYTIDDPSTFEIDDAISLEVINGNYFVWIHISDVSEYISKDSEDDKEAYKKACTTYLLNNVLPIFPNKIITENLSLIKGKQCRALSTRVELSPNGSILSCKIIKSLINIKYRLSYQEANELIDYAPPEEMDLNTLLLLMQKRKDTRIDSGAIIIDKPEGKILSIDGKPTISILEPSPSRMLVSECMILMGTVVGEFGKSYNIPMPFRSQLDPKYPKKLNNIKEISKEIQDVIMKHSFSKSFLGTKANRHSGLGLNCYVQCTSPIRRYTDLIAHRQIKSFIANEDILDDIKLGQILLIQEKKQRQVIETMRESNLDLLSQILLDEVRIVDLIFIKWLNIKDFIGLFYFKRFAIDIVCKLEKQEELLPGDFVKGSLKPNHQSTIRFHLSVG